MDTRQSERYKFEEIVKIHIFEIFTKLNTRHTFWNLVIRLHIETIAFSAITLNAIMDIHDWIIDIHNWIMDVYN